MEQLEQHGDCEGRVSPDHPRQGRKAALDPSKPVLLAGGLFVAFVAFSGLAPASRSASRRAPSCRAIGLTSLVDLLSGAEAGSSHRVYVQYWCRVL